MIAFDATVTSPEGYHKVLHFNADSLKGAEMYVKEQAADLDQQSIHYEIQPSKVQHEISKPALAQATFGMIACILMLAVADVMLRRWLKS